MRCNHAIRITNQSQHFHEGNDLEQQGQAGCPGVQTDRGGRSNCPGSPLGRPSMSAVVVLITKDRDVQCVAAEGADVVVLDFQNMKVGDPLPVLSTAQKALLQTQAPSVQPHRK